MAFGRQEPLVGENPSARARAATILQEYESLKAEVSQLENNVRNGVGDKEANVAAFTDVSSRLKRNGDSITALKNEVYADQKIFDSTLARQLQDSIKSNASLQSSFAPTGAQAANAVKNEQGNGSSAGSTQGNTTPVTNESSYTGPKSSNSRDDRETQVGKTNAQDGSGNGDPSKTRLDGVGMAPGGMTKNMANGLGDPGISLRTGFGQGPSTPVDEDWRVRISLATNSNIFYKSKNPGVQAPLLNTSGVVFPYTPSISVQHNANYGQTKLTHSNYASYFYEGSEVSAITIASEFTAQSEDEGKYVLAALTFFRSCTKMWFGTQTQPLAGNPPPMVFLNGYGKLYFSNVPCVITSFNHTMPAEVDYIEIKHSIDELQPYGRMKTGGIAKTQSEMLSNSATRVPTSSTMSITVQPVYSRKFIHENFNLDSFANGELLLTRGGFL